LKINNLQNLAANNYRVCGTFEFPVENQGLNPAEFGQNFEFAAVCGAVCGNVSH
jgi:hypothetical protein